MIRDIGQSHHYPPTNGCGVNVALRANFSKNLERLLQEKNLTQAQFAKLVGLSPGSISSWLSGRDWPTPENIDKVVSVLAVTPGDLFNDPPSSPRKRTAEDELFDLIRDAARKGKIRITKSDT